MVEGLAFYSHDGLPGVDRDGDGAEPRGSRVGAGHEGAAGEKRGVGRGFEAAERASFDEGDLVGRGHEVGAAVEGVDAVDVPEADAAEHLLDAFGLGADLADDLLRVVGEE